MSLLDTLNNRIATQKVNHLYRSRQVLTTDPARLLFSSNDYLGLSQHPELVTALQQGATRYGVGGCASHLASGYQDIHQQVECAFAEFLQTESAILFSNGFMANQGVITAMTQKQDVIFADKLVHASIIDACRLSHAKLVRYPHLAYARLEEALALHKAQQKLIVTDSVFSMRGELADIPCCMALAKSQQALLLVDDAHGIGVLGERGAGCCEHFKLTSRPILICPLAKAFGVMGAIVAGPAKTIEALVQFARSYRYTTAIPPAYATAILKSLELVQQESWRREKLFSNIAFFKKKALHLGLPVLPSKTPIQAIEVGESEKALQLSQALLKQGIVLTAMRAPTVPVGQACLRVTLSTQHSEQEIETLLTQLSEVMHAVL